MRSLIDLWISEASMPSTLVGMVPQRNKKY
jgi:hypothetical protein